MLGIGHKLTQFLEMLAVILLYPSFDFTFYHFPIHILKHIRHWLWICICKI